MFSSALGRGGDTRVTRVLDPEVPSDEPDRGFATRAIHDACAPPVDQQPASVPLYQTATWRFDTTQQFADVISGRSAGYVYGRGYGNPTVEAFENVMASLEQTEAAFAFVAGTAAIYAVVTMLASTGQRVVASRNLYGGTVALFQRILPKMGIEVQFVEVEDPDAVRAALDGAALFYVETISNPNVAVADLPSLAAWCAEAGVPTVIDNTFASPYLCNPSELGFDFVIHSATKYLGGHSDLVGGVVCCSTEDRARLRSHSLDVGGAMQPFEAWLCLRGLATLELRMERHCSTAAALAEFLGAHPSVRTLHYPGTEGDPYYERARSLLRLPGGMIAFEHAGGYSSGAALCDALGVAWIGASLGGAHTLVAHPASTTHRQLDPASREAAGITAGLIRISVGLESPEDLIRDFAGALEAPSEV